MKFEMAKEFSVEEIEYAMESNNVDVLKQIPFSVGEYSLDFNRAQKICVELLTNSDDAEVRANAVLGLSYLARRFKMLDLNLVLPLIRNELLHNKEWRGRIQESFEDIKLFLGI